MKAWDELATDQSIENAKAALEANGINVVVVLSGEEAKKMVLDTLPKNAEVMTMTSVTLDTAGITKEVNESGNFNSLKNQLMKMDRNTQSLEMQKLGAAPEWTIGSVHAVTENGEVLIASNTGSQLPAYAYGSAHVLWVVGTQKIVKDADEGKKRIYEYILPLETVRARKAYGLPDTFNSNVSKLLIVNKEITPKRITLIFVKEKLGF